MPAGQRWHERDTNAFAFFLKKTRPSILRGLLA
jgi:hypothetical protein